MRVRDFSVYCTWVKGQPKPDYLMVRAPGGCIAPGRQVEIRKSTADAWHPATVVEPWPHTYGTIVCVEPVSNQSGVITPRRTAS